MFEGLFSFVSELNLSQGRTEALEERNIAELPFNAESQRLYFAACWSKLLYLFIVVVCLWIVPTMFSLCLGLNHQLMWWSEWKICRTFFCVFFIILIFPLYNHSQY